MDLNKTSRFISLILRHRPDIIGISLDEHGWASVEELLAGISKTQYIDMAMLEKIVETDSKQRYSFNEEKTLIRANQGHSIDVDVELPKKQPPVILYHGTGENMWTRLMNKDLFQRAVSMSIYLVMKQLQLLSVQDMGDLWCMKYLRVKCTMTVMNSFNL